MNLETICIKVIELTKQVASYINEERNRFSGFKVEAKGKHNFVTYVDKCAEERIVKGLKKIIPDSGFIAEEGTISNDEKKYTWIIDPLDGTTNYIHGVPPYAISIALVKENEIILGVVYEMVMDECFYSYEGAAAFMNQIPIRVSDIETVSESLIATGFPYENYDRMSSFMKTLDHFFNHSHGVRRLGSAATDLAYVACGRYDAFYEYNLNSWDVAAGAFIVQQAGGKVSDFSGGDNFIFGKEIIASNNFIFHEFRNLISQFMN
ncbi:MAG: inositol monophosphatase [Bacteroidales bacterium]|nr:inositol monophosphatase [Bacteroidales bacterium]